MGIARHFSPGFAIWPDFSSSEKRSIEMSTKTYSVRIPQSAPDVTSEQVSTWLHEQTESAAALAPDPGAGPKVLRLTLDRANVEQSAQAADETEAVFLRRLIATRADVKPREQELEKDTADKPRPRPMVLPPRLRLSAEHLEPAVAAFDHFQAFAISRAMSTPEAMAAARLNQEERTQLAAATAELANRRAPAWLVENIDLFGFGSLLLSIEFKKIDAAREVAKNARALRAPQQKEQPKQDGEGTLGGFDATTQ